MLRKILLVSVLGVMLSGCYMAPLAMIGPVSSGFTTASIVQSGISTGASFIVKKSTGKTISEHVLESFEKDVMQQTYMPNNENDLKTQKQKMKIDLGKKVNADCKRYDFYCKRISKKVLAPSFKLN